MSEIDSKEKARFRATARWRNFRQEFTAEKNYTCEACGMTYNKMRRHILNVHHVDPENYDDLSPEKFRALCVTCHEYIEYISRRINGQKFKFFRKFPQVFVGLKYFLILSAQEKGEEILKAEIKQNGEKK